MVSKGPFSLYILVLGVSNKINPNILCYLDSIQSGLFMMRFDLICKYFVFKSVHQFNQVLCKPEDGTMIPKYIVNNSIFGLMHVVAGS